MGYYDDFLEHHGILGQKWGKKSGPPYPLSSQTHNAVTSKASEEERKAAAQRGGGSAASLHTQNAGKKLDLSKIDKEKAKKVAKGVAIGVGTAAAVGTAAWWLKEYHDMPGMLKKVLVEEGKTKVKDISSKAGKAMTLAALNAAGDIAVVKILKKLEPKEGATEAQKDASYIAKKTVKAGLDSLRGHNSTAPDNSNSGKQKNPNLKVDKNSKEYQKLFDQTLTDEERKTIKQKANDGATIEELQEYKRSLKHSSVIEWAESFSYYG